MDNLEPYIIDLKALGTDSQKFQYVVDDKFFEAVGGLEIQKGMLNVDVSVHKRVGSFELYFEIEGCIKVLCDRCLEEMDQHISTSDKLVVKFGSESDDDGETVTLSEKENGINVAWNIYEFASLAIPMRHVHEPGGCSKEMEQALYDVSKTDDDAIDDEDAANTVDHRWDKLKGLKK
jgi:uncharacterized metal-binding protein YceD (DUF177 family)